MIPTHYIRPADTQGRPSGATWLVYGKLTQDGLFTAIDGRKYPAERAVAIEQSAWPRANGHSQA